MNRREMLKSALIAPLAVLIKPKKKEESKLIEDTIQTWHTSGSDNTNPLYMITYTIEPTGKVIKVENKNKRILTS